MRPRGVPETVNPIDHPVTFVIAENGSDVHAFVPEYFQMELVHFMAENLRYVGQNIVIGYFWRLIAPVVVSKSQSKSFMTAIARSTACAPSQPTSKSSQIAMEPSALSAVAQPTFYGICTSVLTVCQDCSEPKIIETQADEKQEEPVSDESEARIPRPRNSWILYRQEKSKAIVAENPGITAAEVCEYP